VTTPEAAAPVAPDELRAVDRLLAERCGISLAGGLQQGLDAALREAARDLGLAPRALAARLRAGEEAAWERLVERVVVGESSFFRHPEQLEALAAELPALDQGGPLLCWSAGCAGGEEPYSLAIALLEADRAGDRIVATDFSAEALARARAGLYDPWALRRVEGPRRERWFRLAEGRLEVVAPVRDLVELRRHNLAHDEPPWRFDVVLCRNVLIYFEPAAAERALLRLWGAVRPGGLLLLGPVEQPLAAGLHAEWIERTGATLLRKG